MLPIVGAIDPTRNNNSISVNISDQNDGEPAQPRAKPGNNEKNIEPFIIEPLVTKINVENIFRQNKGDKCRIKKDKEEREGNGDINSGEEDDENNDENNDNSNEDFTDGENNEGEDENDGENRKLDESFEDIEDEIEEIIDEKVQKNNNSYAAKKTVAQGMMDIALITANANQLRYVLEFSTQTKTFYLNVTLIIISLMLQIGIGVALIFKGKMDIKGKSKHPDAKRINNYVVVGIFLVTIINVFIASFTITESPVTARS